MFSGRNNKNYPWISHRYPPYLCHWSHMLKETREPIENHQCWTGDHYPAPCWCWKLNPGCSVASENLIPQLSRLIVSLMRTNVLKLVSENAFSRFIFSYQLKLQKMFCLFNKVANVRHCHVVFLSFLLPPCLKLWQSHGRFCGDIASIG